MQQTNRRLPLVSIGIPTYNGASRIGKALDSIFNQAYENVEIIVSDNCSTDNTAEIVQKYTERDERIVYFCQPFNKGVAPNFESALELASGKYFFWISDDDELIPGVLERFVEFLEANPTYALVSGQINYWSVEGDLYGWESNLSFEKDNALMRALGYYSKVKSGAMLYGLMRRKLGQKVRFWPTIGSDWHFVAGLAFQGKIKILDFVGYNKQDGGISRNFHNYARVFGERKIWGYLPFVKIAVDAFKEFVWKGKVYQELALPARLLAGSVAFLVVLIHYYLVIQPRIIGGKILRALNIRTPRERKLADRNIQPTEGAV